MADNTNAQQQPPEPSPDLKSLDKLVGTWEVSGGLQGRNTFEWMEGGFFLIQRFDFDHAGRRLAGSSHQVGSAARTGLRLVERGGGDPGTDHDRRRGRRQRPHRACGGVFELLGGGQADAGWDGSGMSSARLAVLPGTTHHNIFHFATLASTVTPFLDAPIPEAG
jgi:hypothetical protein